MQDGKLDKVGFIDYASVMVGGDAAKVKILEGLTTACAAISDDDRCELAYKAGGCLKLGAMQKKIDIGF